LTGRKEASMRMMDEGTRRTILSFQKNEITEHLIYKRLSDIVKHKRNREIIKKISEDELRHYNIWKKYTGRDVKPGKIKYLFYILISRLFGITFSLKLMESGEEGAQEAYDKLILFVLEAGKIKEEEIEHESHLLRMIDEEKLKYIGSVVLGLNDALVELTGTLAGLTFALQNAKLVGVAGLITGIAASLSMAASEYLSTKTEGGAKSPLKASFYTLVAYVSAVVVLILPFLLLQNYIICLLLTLIGAVTLIFFFTFYFSVVREIRFRERFIEMVSISLGVATLSFIIGLIVRRLLGIDI